VNPKHLGILKKGIEEWNEWRKSFRGKPGLSDANLCRADLRRANLSGAYLDEADLSKADLSGADLRGANLSNANLSGAYLPVSHLSQSNLSRACLNGACLSNADFIMANLSGANLSGANLSKADLCGADLREANLSDADLSGAALKQASLVHANLTGAILTGAIITEANISGWIINNVICERIIDKNEKTFSKKDEFEQLYTRIYQIKEIILDIPLSEEAGFIGDLIAYAVNQREKNSLLKLKGLEALSSNKTKFSFISFDPDFKSEILEFIKTGMNEYFQENPISFPEVTYPDSLSETTGGLLEWDKFPLVPGIIKANLAKADKKLKIAILKFLQRREKLGNAILSIMDSFYRSF